MKKPTLLEVGLILIIVAVFAMFGLSHYNKTSKVVSTTEEVKIPIQVEPIVKSDDSTWVRPDPVGTKIVLNLNNKDAFMASCRAQLAKNQTKNK